MSIVGLCLSDAERRMFCESVFCGRENVLSDKADQSPYITGIDTHPA